MSRNLPTMSQAIQTVSDDMATVSDDLPVEGRITNKAGRGDKPRYIRPVERQRMRPWLISHLDNNDIPGLVWQSKHDKVFRISWKHAANQCFNMQKDTNLFERWAIHTGRHQDSDHKRWKANFRCALNSLPDVIEHKEQGIKKGNNAFKVYRFLDEKETKMNKELKCRRKKEPPDFEADEEGGNLDHSYAEAELGDDILLDIPRLEQLYHSTGIRLKGTDLREKLRPLRGHMDDPNLQDILAAATASLAAGSSSVNLEKISIEQLSHLGEMSKMKLDIPEELRPADTTHLDAFFCSWCDKVFPSKIEIFKHFLIAHHNKLLAKKSYKRPAEPAPADPSDPKYQKLQQEIKDLEKEVFNFNTADTFQAAADDVENEEVVSVTSEASAENQALDLSVKSKGSQSVKEECALDLSMSGSKKNKTPKSLQGKFGTKRRRSSLEIDYTVKFGNYGLAGAPRTKRQMSLHTRKKEEEEEKLAKKNATVDNADTGSQRSVEDLVHAEILMSLQTSAADDGENSNDGSTSSVKVKKEASKGKKLKGATKKSLQNLAKVIDDVAKGGVEKEAKVSAESDKDKDKDKKSETKLKFKAFRCGLCMKKFDDPSVLNNHVEEHKKAEKLSPFVKLKPDRVLQSEAPSKDMVVYHRQLMPGNVQTVWKCQIASSSGACNVYVCGICKMKFHSLPDVAEHEKVHGHGVTSKDDEDALSNPSIVIENVEEEKSEEISTTGSVIQINSEHSVLQQIKSFVEAEKKSGIVTQKATHSGDEEVKIESRENLDVKEETVETKTDTENKIEDNMKSGEVCKDDIEDGKEVNDDAEIIGETVKSAEYIVVQAENEVTTEDGDKTEDDTKIIGETVDSAGGMIVHESEDAGAEKDETDEQDEPQEDEPQVVIMVQNVGDDVQKTTDIITEDMTKIQPDDLNEGSTLNGESDSQKKATKEAPTEPPSSLSSVCPMETDQSHDDAKVEAGSKENKPDIAEEIEVMSDKTKVLQCNVPSFLEVSTLAEGYEIKKEEEMKELRLHQKKMAALQSINCGICNMKIQKQDIKSHLDRHKPKEGNELYEDCIICQKVIARSGMNEHLKAHSVIELSLAEKIRVHNTAKKSKKQQQERKEGETRSTIDMFKMFVCNLCNFGFEDCNALAEHVEQHLKPDTSREKERNEGEKNENGNDDKSQTEIIVIPERDNQRKNGNENSSDKPQDTTTATSVSTVKQVPYVETDPKKNSLLAAALSSAPKYKVSIPPRTYVVSKTGGSAVVGAAGTQGSVGGGESGTQSDGKQISIGNLQSVLNDPKFVGKGEKSAGSTVPATATSAGVVSALSALSSTGALSNLDVASMPSESAAAALRDTLCLKFPLVLLKPGSENGSDNGKLETKENVSSMLKQNTLSVPVVLVKQDNQELKLLPVSSVLNLTSLSKTADSANTGIKITPSSTSAPPSTAVASTVSTPASAVSATSISSAAVAARVAAASSSVPVASTVLLGRKSSAALQVNSHAPAVASSISAALASKIVNSKLSAESLNTSVSISKPPILYAPVPSISTASVDSMSNPVPITLYANQVNLKAKSGDLTGKNPHIVRCDTVQDFASTLTAAKETQKKTESQNLFAKLLDSKGMLVQQKSSGKTSKDDISSRQNGSAIPSVQNALTEAVAIAGIKTQSQVLAPAAFTQKKTESQNIIAKLLDSKGKLVRQTSQKSSGKVSNDDSLSGQNGSAITSVQNALTEAVAIAGIKTQSQVLAPSAFTPETAASLLGIKSMQPPGPIQTTLAPKPVDLGSAVQLSTQAPAILVYKKSDSASITNASEYTLTSKQVPNPAPILTSLSGENLMSSTVPSKLGRPTIPRNTAVFIQNQPVTMATKTAVSSPALSTAAPIKLLMTPQHSQAGAIVFTRAAQPAGIQLQPHMMNMMLSQLILSQTGQAITSTLGTPATTVTMATGSATNPKPTFNLVFAPQQQATPVTTAAGVPAASKLAVTSLSPIATTSTTTVTGSQQQSLILMCKTCNQSLDNIGLMGSHVCQKPPAVNPQTLPSTSVQPQPVLLKPQQILVQPPQSPQQTLIQPPQTLIPQQTLIQPQQTLQILQSIEHHKDANSNNYIHNTLSQTKCLEFNDNYEKSQFAEHVKKHQGGSETETSICTTQKEMQLEDEKITCRYCQSEFTSSAEYEFHVLYDHQWQCNTCKHRFSNQTQLFPHVMIDLEDFPTLNCKRCHRDFTSKDEMKAHVGSVHPDFPALNCRKCNKYFPSKDSFEVHIGLDHPGESGSNCISPNSFDVEAYLQRPGDCVCPCERCDIGFTDVGGMMRHIQTGHYTVVIFTCGICGENLPNRTSLQFHEHFCGVKKEDMQFCYQCFMLFPKGEAYTNHMSKHQGHVTKHTKSRLKSVLQDKAKSTEMDKAKLNTVEPERKITEKGDNRNENEVWLKSIQTNDNVIASDGDVGVAMEQEIGCLATVVMSGGEIAAAVPPEVIDVNMVAMETDTSEDTGVTQCKKGPEKLDAAVTVPDNSNTADLESSEDKSVTHLKTVPGKLAVSVTGLDVADASASAAYKPVTKAIISVGVSGDAIECSDCRCGPFKSKYLLKQHRVIKHLYPRNRPSTSYYQHMVENLRRTKRLECGMCDRKFESQTNLLRHQISHRLKKSLNNKPVNANESNIDRTDSDKLMSSDTSDINVTADISESGIEATTIDDDLAVGNLVENGQDRDVYCCNICNKDCENLSGLNHHLLDDHKDLLNRCDKCLAYFLSKHDLTEHDCPALDRDTNVLYEAYALDNQVTVSDNQVTVSDNQEIVSEQQEIVSEGHEFVSEHHEIVSEHQNSVSEHQEIVLEHQELVTEHQEIVLEHPEIVTEHQELVTEHQENVMEIVSTAQGTELESIIDNSSGELTDTTAPFIYE